MADGRWPSLGVRPLSFVGHPAINLTKSEQLLPVVNSRTFCFFHPFRLVSFLSTLSATQARDPPQPNNLVIPRQNAVRLDSASGSYTSPSRLVRPNLTPTSARSLRSLYVL